jgi:hypothetical protein
MQQETEVNEQTNPLLDLETGNVDPADSEYSPRMDDFDRQFKQLNRIVSSAEYDDPEDDAGRPTGLPERNSSRSASAKFNPKRLDHIDSEDSFGKQLDLLAGEESSGREKLVGAVKKEISVEDTDDIDFEIWESTDIPKPPKLADMPTLEDMSLDIESGESGTASAGVEEAKQNRLLSSLPPYVQNFEQAADPVKMVISKIPEELVKAQHAEMESAAAKRRLDILNATKKRERGLLQREHLARARVEQMEADAQERLRREAERNRLLEREREVDMGIKFRQAREEIEAHLERKDAQLREVFGEVTTDQVSE